MKAINYDTPKVIAKLKPGQCYHCNKQIRECCHRQPGEHSQGCNNSYHPSFDRAWFGCNCIAAKERLAMVPEKECDCDKYNKDTGNIGCAIAWERTNRISGNVCCYSNKRFRINDY